MRITFVERLLAGFDDMRGRRKIRLANLQVNDMLALSFQGPCPAEDVERALHSQPSDCFSGLHRDDFLKYGVPLRSWSKSTLSPIATRSGGFILPVTRWPPASNVTITN